MQAQHRRRVVERFARVGGLVVEGLEALIGFSRGADSPPGVRIFGNATMARCMPRQTFHEFAYSAPRSLAKRGIVVIGWVGLNDWIEGNRGQSTRIDLRMKCQASS